MTTFMEILMLLSGTLFQQLEEQGQLDNTYVFYSADNG
jgi:arylsulfatase A-like enzyme